MDGQLRIERMYAFVAVDKDGTEGIPAFPVNGVILPLVGADMERIRHLMPYAQACANSMGAVVKLVVFSTRTEVETIRPTHTN